MKKILYSVLVVCGLMLASTGGWAQAVKPTNKRMYKSVQEATAAQKNNVAVRSLDLRNQNLTSLPPELFELTDLKVLILDNNQLQSIPSEISKLQKLSVLNLRNNQLRELPASLTSLTDLRLLTLGNNKLSSLPTGWGAMTHLFSLDITQNQFTAFPSALSEMVGKNTEFRSFLDKGNPYSGKPSSIPANFEKMIQGNQAKAKANSKAKIIYKK
ncbi:Leucine rich repeat-containing protein [Flexibacter flexilis DSM 6793]|uniref:Leucine rich repeat-containing protein n=1 Tax=Flexibacter flexilis DSM 6793 TaxID=927664 RepID=A0A1I1HYZ4_9BACT|nr:leucine-rich repeat domain-containing protein [Flexibacter flexilis]SFC29061.1 Leucine rich repeat-containing protein [Flexibacter flexilis DSM 6793]